MTMIQTADDRHLNTFHLCRLLRVASGLENLALVLVHAVDNQTHILFRIFLGLVLVLVVLQSFIVLPDIVFFIQLRPIHHLRKGSAFVAMAGVFITAGALAELLDFAKLDVVATQTVGHLTKVVV